MFKKRSGKRILSFLLATMVIIASVPFALAEYVEYEQHTVTGTDGKAYTYFTNGSQYVRSGGSGNEYLNVWADNAFYFMLTEPTQKFTFDQSLRLQCAYRLSASSLCFNDIVYYTGQDLVGTMRIEGIPDGENKTATLIGNNGLNVIWGVDANSGNSNAQKVVNSAISGGTYEEGKIPWGYEFEVSFINVTGNSNYYWLGTSSFETDKGMDETFYYAISWYDEVSDMEKDSLTDRDNVTNQQIFPTRLVVTDVRELIAEVEKIKEILNNPNGYTDEQIERYEKYIESIPEGMIEGTTFYTQEQVDTVYDYITGEIEGFADTEEYMYYREKALALIEKNSGGTYVNSDIYTSNSLSTFETAFKAVDIGAYFPYPASRQNEVDEATAAIKGAFSELVGVNTETHSSNGTTTDTVWETTDGIDVPSGDTDNDHTVFKLSNTSYKFVQVSDNQKFTFTQELMGKAKNVSYSLLGAVRPNFESLTFDATCDGTNCLLDEESGFVNNTESFIERLDSSSKTTTDNVTSFKGWKYNSRSGDTVHGFNLTNGVLQQTLLTSDTQFLGSTTYHTFYGDATILFAGNDKETDENGNRVTRATEIDTSFYWKLTSSYDGTYYHAHIPVEILITDVRPLADLYYELHKLTYFSASVEERAKYPAESIEEVKNALASVPGEMLLGTEYYTQDEVNSYYNALLTAKNNLEFSNIADYSQLNSLIASAEEILNATDVVYTDSSKAELQSIYNTAIALDKELPPSEQQRINEIVSDLSAALEGVKVKADYSALDEAIEKAKDKLNDTNTKYTESAKQLLNDSLTNAENINRDLSTDDQSQIDEIVQEIKDATDNLTEAADTSSYENAVKNAEEIIAEGNSQGRYDEEDWNSFVDSVTNAKDIVGGNPGDVPKSEQDKIDSATETIKNATEEIYNKRYIFIKFKGESDEIFKTYRVQYTSDLTFNALIDIPELPESDNFKKYIGWYYQDNTAMQLTDAITEDVDVFCLIEEIKISVKSGSGAVIDESKDFFKGLKHGTTVQTLLSSLDNNIDFIVVKDYNGNVVGNSQLIATGMSIELVSRENSEVIHEKLAVVVCGDINGDGLVNDEDYEKSRGMCLKTTEYTMQEAPFFAANDTDNDGVLDVIDLFNISNMRYGN
ncbi:MAG: FIVAR domain-containing protein [Clostridia bacterium]|nr:FIVAR domain-containing protein [Clostridia bacterium]